MRIKLPIIFHTEESYQAEKLGLDVPIEDGDVKEMIFYQIDALSPYTSNKNNFTKIYTSANNFICTLNINQVDQLIQSNNEN